MRVGVILSEMGFVLKRAGIPHASGGDPLWTDKYPKRYAVFPMRVGVIPYTVSIQ